MKMMRNNLSLMLVVVFLVLFTACSKVTFEGSKSANENQLKMEYSTFTGTDNHTMTLQRGEKLSVEVVSEKGSIGLDIEKQGGDGIYLGTQLPTSSFSVSILEDGDYIVSVKGEKAQGSIRIVKEEREIE